MGFLCVFVTVFPVLGQSDQSFPKAEVFGGYSYANIDTNGLSSRQSANGWEGGVVGNFNKWLGAEFEANGYYKTYSIPTIADVKVRDYSYLAGPRATFKFLFVHALFGGDQLSGSALGYSASQTGFGGAFGGGVKWKLSGPWSIRASVDYAFTRHNIFGGSSYTQNNYRAGIGIAYSFGARSRERAFAQPDGGPASVIDTSLSRPVAAATDTSMLQIDSLGITARSRSAHGAEILAVSPGSVADLVSLRAGEVITAVDGRPVNSPSELASELQNRPPGSQVKLTYIFQTSAIGWANNEVNVVLK